MDTWRQTHPRPRGDGRGEYRQGPRHPLRVPPAIPRPEPGDLPAPVQLDPDEQGRSISAVARVMRRLANCLLTPEAAPQGASKQLAPHLWRRKTFTHSPSRHLCSPPNPTCSGQKISGWVSFHALPIRLTHGDRGFTEGKVRNEKSKGREFMLRDLEHEERLEYLGAPSRFLR